MVKIPSVFSNPRALLVCVVLAGCTTPPYVPAQSGENGAPSEAALEDARNVIKKAFLGGPRDLGIHKIEKKGDTYKETHVAPVGGWTLSPKFLVNYRVVDLQITPTQIEFVTSAGDHFQVEYQTFSVSYYDAMDGFCELVIAKQIPHAFLLENDCKANGRPVADAFALIGRSASKAK